MKRFGFFLMGLGLLVFANPEFAEIFAWPDNGGFESGVQDNGVGDAWDPFASAGC